MNVASKELCQELYELSGWTPGNNVGIIVPHPDWNNADGVFPAYDLGYLLRKLPNQGNGIFAGVYTGSNDCLWEAECSYAIDKPTIYGQADTPEDAACKLAIELFKQGILKK